MTTASPAEMQSRIEELERQVVAALARVQSSETELINVRTRLQTSEDEHRRVHGELEKAQTNGGGGKGLQFRLIDPKTMIPEKFGSKSGPT